MILAQGICHYDSTIAGLEAINKAATADAKTSVFAGTSRPVIVVPLLTISKLRLELRILLDRWDREFPDAIREVGVFDRRDIGLRAGLVRSWLTVHVDELDQRGGDESESGAKV